MVAVAGEGELKARVLREDIPPAVLARSELYEGDGIAVMRFDGCPVLAEVIDGETIEFDSGDWLGLGEWLSHNGVAFEVIATFEAK